MTHARRTAAVVVFALIGATPVTAQEPFTAAADKVNPKLVKLFGAGGFAGLPRGGTGILVSPDGHILTVASQLLDTPEVVVHLYDGRRMVATVVAQEPELDAALLKIKVEGKKATDPTDLELPFFDFAAAAARPPLSPATWVLAFSNAFEAGLRDEAMSAQRGVVAAYTKLSGRRGVFDFPYTGDVYVLDAVTNNPGAAGGALTNRAGELVGMIGRDLSNAQTETMINYAVPVAAKVTVRVKVNDAEQTVNLSLPEFVEKGMKGTYKPVARDRPAAGEGGFTGIVFVPNILDRTPAYVEDVVPGSPAAKAGVMVNDLVSFVDGEPVPSVTAFEAFLKARTRPGTVIRVEVRRGGALQPLYLTLDPFPVRSKAVVPPAPAGPRQVSDRCRTSCRRTTCNRPPGPTGGRGWPRITPARTGCGW